MPVPDVPLVPDIPDVPLVPEVPDISEPPAANNDHSGSTSGLNPEFEFIIEIYELPLYRTTSFRL